MRLDIDYIIKKLHPEYKRYQKKGKQKRQKQLFSKNLPKKSIRKRKTENILLIHLRILSILNNSVIPLTKREIVRRYCEKYEGIFFNENEKLRDDYDLSDTGSAKAETELNKEVKKTTYRDWINGLLNSKLIIEVTQTARTESMAANGPIPPSYKINPKASLSVDGFATTEDIKMKEAIKTLNVWMAICDQLNFFPIKVETIRLIEKLFPNFSGSEPIEWVQTTSLSANISYKENTDGQTVADKLWIIAQAIKDNEKITFLKGKKEMEGFVPALLREHRGKWYVVGFYSKSVNPKIYPYSLTNIDEVDSGEALNRDEKRILDNQKVKIKKLFNDSLGIYTSWHNSETKDPKADPNSPHIDIPLTISFKVKDGNKFDNISYLKKDKIHPSQPDAIEKDENGYATITLKCFPDADLIREIRKLGQHNVKDIECSWPEGIDKGPLPNLEKWIWEL